MTAIDISPCLDSGPSPAHGTNRRVREIQTGWHVRIEERWFLVNETLPLTGSRVLLELSDGTSLSAGRADWFWTRTPAEQMAAISALLPTRPGGYRPARHEILGNPFRGSAPKKAGVR